LSAGVAIVGAGPSGLFAAETLAKAGLAVDLYERMPSPARKFLIAGRGGLNLTHSEDLDRFLARYGAAAAPLLDAVRAFPPAALRQWADDLGAETFIGSSGRIFPKAMKAAPLLRAWLRRLETLGVKLHVRWRWLGFDGEALSFATPEGVRRIAPAATILALGGASWPRRGSDGGWVAALDAAGASVTPLAPANCGVEIPWSDYLRNRFAGAALKNVALRGLAGEPRGDVVLTATGLEGGPIYKAIPELRAALRRAPTHLALDLRPDLPAETLAARLAAKPAARSWPTHLAALGLTPAMVALVREAGPFDAATLVGRIKRLQLPVLAAAGLDRAISTAGGVAFSSVTPTLMLRARPGVFVAGEMLDWEAPTGGYLLQGAFATGRLAALGAMAWLGRR
jgi:uncharacterized flavoprotein (TIGR03862 family)